MANETKTPPKEQSTLKWLLGFKETPDEASAAKARKEKEARERASIDRAIRGAAAGAKAVKQLTEKK